MIFQHIGECYGGKTMAWKTLAASLPEVTKQPAPACTVINPKALKIEQGGSASNECIVPKVQPTDPTSRPKVQGQVQVPCGDFWKLSD